MHLALKSFKARIMRRYRLFITLTAVLGALFAILQYNGFNYLYSHGVQVFGVGSNPSASFLGIIIGLHALHVIGGVIALFIIFLRAYSLRVKRYNVTSIEIISTYWHFVDILWIYLFIFLKWL
ncbi:MAG TPA: cytochrome c oxidase subunit 3, partial [Parafilimonas sp.]|nr:cytochrome c oxidase subunit 3 [Parafilimonas sp.]